MDRFYQVEKFISEGEAQVAESRVSPGGSAANTIYALSKLGLKTGFLGAVGHDAAGERLVRELAEVGVDTKGVKVKAGAPTGEALALVDKRGKRAIYVMPGANSLLETADIDASYLKGAAYLHLSSFAGEEQFQLQIELSRRLPQETRLSLAPGMLYAQRGLSALLPLLQKAHLVFFNAQELKVLTGEGVSAGAKRLHQEGCRIVVVTLGGGRRGVCYLWDGKEKEEYRVKARVEVKTVVDTTGAGDAFCAGFLFGQLRGESLAGCALLAEI
ncbi:MAG: PfkB family carbohydrate kinase, partial [Chloroflexota bacterium]